MPGKRFTVEQIIHNLREADVLLSQGKTVGEVCRRIGENGGDKLVPRKRRDFPAAGGVKLCHL